MKRDKLSLAVRVQVYLRDNGICHICGEPVALEEYHVDHALSIRLGGSNDMDNLKTAHRGCNLRKQGRPQIHSSDNPVVRRLDAWRQASRLSITNLANQLKYERPYISDILRGERKVTDGFIGRFCLVYGFDVAERIFLPSPTEEQTA